VLTRMCADDDVGRNITSSDVDFLEGREPENAHNDKGSGKKDLPDFGEASVVLTRTCANDDVGRNITSSDVDFLEGREPENAHNDEESGGKSLPDSGEASIVLLNKDSDVD
jgi:hypothetical protein